MKICFSFALYQAKISFYTEDIFKRKDEGLQAFFSYLPEIDIKISTKPAFWNVLMFAEILLQKLKYLDQAF